MRNTKGGSSQRLTFGGLELRNLGNLCVRACFLYLLAAESNSLDFSSWTECLLPRKKVDNISVKKKFIFLEGYRVDIALVRCKIKQ